MVNILRLTLTNEVFYCGRRILEASHIEALLPDTILPL